MTNAVSAPKLGGWFLAIVLVGAASIAPLVATGRAPQWVAVSALMLLFGTIAFGVGIPSSGIFARPVLRGPAGRGVLALTFDDGPDPRWTPPLLDLLESRGQRGTFFVIGWKAAQHVELVAEIARRGHEVANHTWYHSYTTVMRHPRRLADELDRTSALIEKWTGVTPRWFRPPVGLLSPRIAPAVALTTLRLVTWTATARDGVQSSTTHGALGRLANALVPGAILVLHDARIGGTEPIAIHVLGLLLDRMDALNLRSVTLSELCAPEPAATPFMTDRHPRVLPVA